MFKFSASLSMLLMLALSGCTLLRPALEHPPAPEGDPVNGWVHDDALNGGFRGIGTARAYSTLLRRKSPGRTVVVAVIDSGIDTSHEDLQGLFWTNEAEVAGNGADDDGNGYVDDIHGWNFIGGADGENVDFDTYELTREYVKLRDKYQEKTLSEVPDEEHATYAYFLEVKQEFESKVQEAEEQYYNVLFLQNAIEASIGLLTEHLGVEEVTRADLARVDTSKEELANARAAMTFMFDNGFTLEELTEYKDDLETDIQYRYNPGFDPRGIVGDNAEDAREARYGNNDVRGPDPKHGTHVAGIIAANRTNHTGAVGIADAVRIMIVRAVPAGDERDKDVANAIRYAVDNGANIINMSFGKSFSPDRPVVEEAIRYADARGVLMIHAAGNDGVNVDSTANFPMPGYVDGGHAVNWITVGATARDGGDQFVAAFSNYGRGNVDVFAPGVDIYSTLPDQAYGRLDGTSMAAPVVSGLAALLMSYYPALTASEVKQIILESVTPYPDEEVILPGSADALVPFTELSATGGVVDAYAALRLAEERSR